MAYVSSYDDFSRYDGLRNHDIDVEVLPWIEGDDNYLGIDWKEDSYNDNFNNGYYIYDGNFDDGSSSDWSITLEVVAVTFGYSNDDVINDDNMVNVVLFKVCNMGQEEVKDNKNIEILNDRSYV